MARKAPVSAAGVIGEDELRLIVASLARSGNMPACRFYFETWIRPSVVEVKPGGVDPLREVDDLARRRRAV